MLPGRKGKESRDGDAHHKGGADETKSKRLGGVHDRSLFFVGSRNHGRDAFGAEDTGCEDAAKLVSTVLAGEGERRALLLLGHGCSLKFRWVAIVVRCVLK